MTLLNGISTTISYGGLTFGSVDANGVKWRIDTFQGWGSEQSTIQVVRNVRQSGGWAGPSFMAERYLTLTLVVAAPTAALLNTALDSLHAAVRFGPALFSVTEAGTTRSMIVRRSSVGVNDNKVSSTIAYPTFQVLALLPEKLGTTLSGSPVVNGAALVLHNPGNTAGPVALTIHGAITAPRIVQTAAFSPEDSSSTVRTFSLSSTIASGTSVVVNMTDHSALLGVASQAKYISSRQWFLFQPGDNSFTFSGTGVSGASLSVLATPAWL